MTPPLEQASDTPGTSPSQAADATRSSVPAAPLAVTRVVRQATARTGGGGGGTRWTRASPRHDQLLLLLSLLPLLPLLPRETARGVGDIMTRQGAVDNPGVVEVGVGQVRAKGKRCILPGPVRGLVVVARRGTVAGPGGDGCRGRCIEGQRRHRVRLRGNFEPRTTKPVCSTLKQPCCTSFFVFHSKMKEYYNVRRRRRSKPKSHSTV